jgi:branched-chain amino acid transport system permease protein
MIILQLIINGIIAGLIYSLVALGFYLIYKSTKIFNLAHGAIYTVTPYLFLAWAALFNLISPNGFDWLFAAEICLALLSVCALGVISEIIVFRPLDVLKASPAITFISSLGLYTVLINFVSLIFGNSTQTLNPLPQQVSDWGGIILTQMQFVQLVVSTVIVGVFFFFLHKLSLGRNIRALADNQILAGVLGLNVKNIRLQIFILGSLLAGIAALLKSFDVGADIQSGLNVVVTAAVAAIVGGGNSAFAVVVGSLFLGLTHNFVAWFFSAEWQNAATFVVLFAVLVFRPSGFLSTHLRLEESR